MFPLPIIAFVALGTLLGCAWHNQLAQNEPEGSECDSAASGDGRIDWVRTGLWSLIYLSLIGFLLAGWLVWRKCHG
jgi:hypothetical protein